MALSPPPPEDLRRAARAYIWLYDFRHGVSTARIAADSGFSERLVRQEIARARSYDVPPADRGPNPFLRLIPLFPCTPFVPASKCGHHGPIRAPFVCMVCHASAAPPAPWRPRRPRPEPAAAVA